MLEKYKRTCILCGEVKLISMFYVHKGRFNSIYINKRCKQCDLQLRKDFYRKHKERILKRREDTNKKYYKRVKTKICRQGKEYRQTKEGRFSQYKHNTMDRKRFLNLDLVTYCEIISHPCYYCGEYNERLGIDRMDNEKGYTKENSVSCCAFCNTAKMHHSVEYFLEKIKKIYEKWINTDGKT